jgi:hypothetical protein
MTPKVEVEVEVEVFGCGRRRRVNNNSVVYHLLLRSIAQIRARSKNAETR